MDVEKAREQSKAEALEVADLLTKHGANAFEVAVVSGLKKIGTELMIANDLTIQQMASMKQKP